VNRGSTYLAALFLSGLATGCGGPDYVDTRLPQEAHVIEALLLGDSLTVMEGYVELVQDELSEFEAWRSARAGYTTRHWIPSWGFYDRFQFHLYRPRVAVVLLGTNDARIPNRIPVDEYIDNLAIIAHALLDDGAGKVVLMTAPKNFLRPQPAEVLERLEQYAYALTWFCMAPDDDIECGPDLYSMLDETDFIDGIHPNTVGHERIAEALLPYLVDLE